MSTITSSKRKHEIYGRSQMLPVLDNMRKFEVADLTTRIDNMASLLQRNGTIFMKELPKSAGKIVSMVVFRDRVYVASEKSIWMFHPDKPTRLIRCKFTVERNG